MRKTVGLATLSHPSVVAVNMWTFASTSLMGLHGRIEDTFILECNFAKKIFHFQEEKVKQDAHYERPARRGTALMVLMESNWE